MRPSTITTLVASLLAALALSACSPKFNWRDYSSTHAPYRVMFPDKPSSHTRPVNLDGLTVDMTMTAVDIDGTMFAVGSAEAPDAARAQAAVGAMKTALLKNIGATLQSEKAVPGVSAIRIEASGTSRGQPMRLVGRFEARDKRFYQVVVMGKASDMTPENVDMFLSSFKLE